MNNIEFTILNEISSIFSLIVDTNLIEKNIKENVILNEDVLSKEEMITYFKMKNSIEKDIKENVILNEDVLSKEEMITYFKMKKSMEKNKKNENTEYILSNFNVKESDASKCKILYLLDS